MENNVCGQETNATGVVAAFHSGLLRLLSPSSFKTSCNGSLVGPLKTKSVVFIDVARSQREQIT